MFFSIHSTTCPQFRHSLLLYCRNTRGHSIRGRPVAYNRTQCQNRNVQRVESLAVVVLDSSSSSNCNIPLENRWQYCGTIHTSVASHTPRLARRRHTFPCNLFASSRNTHHHSIRDRRVVCNYKTSLDECHIVVQRETMRLFYHSSTFSNTFRNIQS